MAITIFLLLNGLAVVFLSYVLVSFWREGHRQKNNSMKYAAEFGQSDWLEVAVVTHPISHSAQGGLSVIPFRPREQKSGGKSNRGSATRETIEMPLRRVSTW